MEVIEDKAPVRKGELHQGIAKGSLSGRQDALIVEVNTGRLSAASRQSSPKIVCASSAERRGTEGPTVQTAKPDEEERQKRLQR